MKQHLRLYIILACMFVAASLLPVYAQGDDLAAVLEVLDGTVEVNRVNTQQWIAVRVEAIVGVGDHIRTDGTGHARITFFSDGIDTELLPNSEMRIDQFSGSEQTFDLNVAVLIGETAQRIGRALDASSRYTVTTPGMSLAARGTQFAVRVEDGGRSAMLVSEGTVEAGKDASLADVPPEFGIRSAVDGVLSDVVHAKTFAELDSALDGCTATLTTTDDVSLNVRIAPNLNAPRVGIISASDINKLVGVTENGHWYRIEFRGGFGWVLSSTAAIQEPCAGLRTFPNDQGPEDAALYTSLGEVITLDEIQSTIQPTLQPTPAATPGA